MNCENCPFKKDLESWFDLLKLLRIQNIKDYSSWKKIDELYTFLRNERKVLIKNE